MEINKVLGPFKLKITIEEIDAEMEQKIIRKNGNLTTERLGIPYRWGRNSYRCSNNTIMNYLIRSIDWYEYIKDEQEDIQ